MGVPNLFFIALFMFQIHNCLFVIKHTTFRDYTCVSASAMYAQPRGRMGKRRRTPLSEDDDEPTQSTPVRSKKKSKQGEDALEKLLSLLSTEGSQIAGDCWRCNTVLCMK